MIGFQSWTTLLLVLLIATGAAYGQVITVTTSADSVDVAATATVADLPGPDGVVSFREALLVSDNEAGRQTIGFEIPEFDWYLPNIVPGRVLLQGSFSFSASEPVTIDGTTQTAFTGDTHPGGNELILPLQTYLNGGDSIVTGLESSRVELGGANNEVYGNTGGMDIRFVLATQGIAHDNEADNINITYSSDCLVVRNVTARVRVTGLGTVSPATGNIIGGPNVADRNFITGFGNYGEHGTPAGDCIELYYTDNTLIQNNYIGTTPDGMAISNPACTVGIAMYNHNNNVIVRDNLIAIHAVGVFPVAGVSYGQEIYIDLYEGGTGIELTGNTMGLNALGAPVLAGVNGVLVSPNAFEEGAGVTIGGPNPGEGNVIAGHISTGVLMMNGPGVPAIGHIRMSGNSIYANGDIGIDLMPNTWDFGMTPNDPMDADAGANGLQNFPELASATSLGNSVNVVGTLHSTPSKVFTIELFASPACDTSGFGQGERFLGATTVNTDAAGNASFDATLPANVPAGWAVTATATLEPMGATSEFSACVSLAAGSSPYDLDGDGDVDLGDFSMFSLCFAGSNNPPAANCPAGIDADFDNDGDVDLGDFSLFSLSYTGAS